MITTDTFHFTAVIDGVEHDFVIIPSNSGYRIEENGVYKGELNAERQVLKGEMRPSALASVTGWIIARY